MSASLTPSLYSRTWLAQGLVSGVALAVGYAVGSGVAFAGRRIVRRPPRRVGGLMASAAFVAVVAGTPLWAVSQHLRWQDDVRQLMGVGDDVAAYPVLMTAVALASGYLFVVLGRLARRFHRRYVRLIARVVPRRGQRIVRALLLVVLATFVVDAGRGVGPHRAAGGLVA